MRRWMSVEQVEQEGVGIYAPLPQYTKEELKEHRKVRAKAMRRRRRKALFFYTWVALWATAFYYGLYRIFRALLWAMQQEGQ